MAAELARCNSVAGKCVVALCLAALFAGSGLAQPPPGKGHRHGQEGTHAEASPATALIRADITLERARQLAVKHQAVGYKGLPPGIRKNLGRGKPLPPGIARRGVPADVLGGLPRYPGYEWGVVGSDLILIEVASQVIAEVLSGVFR